MPSQLTNLIACGNRENHVDPAGRRRILQRLHPRVCFWEVYGTMPEWSGGAGYSLAGGLGEMSWLGVGPAGGQGEGWSFR